MYCKLLSFLLFACQIILNRSHFIDDTMGPMINLTPTRFPASSNLPEGYVRSPHLHAAYKLYTGDVNWLQARNLCIADNAHLAITDSVEKIQLIRRMHTDIGEWISVGIHKSKTTDQWVRVDNDLPVENIPWLAHNPDDAGDCTGISLLGNALINYGCDYGNLWYVCEITI